MQLKMHRKDEETLREMGEITGDLVWKVDTGGVFTYIDSSSENMIGFSPRELLGKTIYSLLEPGGDRGLSTLFRGGGKGPSPFRHREHTLIHKKGYPVHAEFSGVPVFDEKGKLEGFQGIARDISRQKKEGEFLARRYQFERLLSQVQGKFVNTAIARIDQAIDYALQVGGEFYRVDRSYLFQFSPDAKTMDNTYEWCREGIGSQKNSIQGFPVREMPSFISKIWNRDYYYVPDVELLPPEAGPEKREFQRQEIQSLICLPVIDEGKVIGFLGFDSVTKKKEWSGEEIKQVNYIAEIFSSVMARQQAEEALRASESKLRQITDNMTDVVWTTDLDFKATYVSPSVERLYGIPVEKYLERTPQERFPVSSLVKIHQAKMNELEKEKDPNADKNRSLLIELEQYRGDGSIINVLMHNKIIRDKKGKPIGFQGVTRDITQIKQAEKVKQEAEQQVREAHQGMLTVLGSIDASIYVADMETHELLYVNQPGRESPGSIKGKKCFQVFQGGQPGPCSFCINDKLLDAEGLPTGLYQWEFKNPKNGRWYDCRDTALRWVDGRMVKLGMSTDITEFKEMQGELQKEKNKLANILEKILDTTAIWIDRMDADGKVVYWNKAAEEISGYTAEEIMGRENVWELLFPGPGYREKHIRKVQNLTGKGERIDNLETRIQRKDGYFRTILWNINSLVDGGRIVGTISLGLDITKRKEAEEALQESKMKLQASEESYRFLADNTPDYIYSLDREFRFTFVNQAFCRSLGMESHEIKGKRFLDLGFPGEVVQQKEKLHDQVLGSQKTIEAEIIVPWLDGEIHTFDVVLVPVFDEIGAITGIRGTSRDITERKRMEQEIIKADKLESIGILAGGIAHDFNNYLAVLLGNASLARYHKDDPDQMLERIENIKQATMRARALSNQLFAFAQGAAPVKKTVSLVQSLVDNINFTLSGSNISCDPVIAPDLFLVDIDEGQLNQVINNIVLNAVQAMPRGGIIKATAGNITLKADPQGSKVPLPAGNYVKISIKDEGTGIPEKYQSKIFDPFFTTKEKGRGLGLATSYTIMQNHGGYIRAESEVGVGTTFYLYLPASQETVTSIHKAGHILYGAGKILVMDDQEAFLQITRDTLSSFGYSVMLAQDGREAVNIYLDELYKGQPFDLVIMDLTIPGGMGDKEAIQELLQKDPGAKAIAVSGYSQDPVMANYQDYGFKGVLKKPFSMVELSELVYDMINS